MTRRDRGRRIEVALYRACWVIMGLLVLYLLLKLVTL